MNPPGTEAAKASIALVVAFAARYCPSDESRTQILVEGPSYFDEQIEVAERTENSDFRAVDRIASLDESILDSAERLAYVEELEGIISRTESPEAAGAAGNLLASGRLGPWELGRDLVAGTPMELRLLELQSAAVVMRQCEISRACGPLSLQVMRLCAPALCSSATSVRDFFEQTFSPVEWAVIQQMQNEIRG